MPPPRPTTLAIAEVWRGRSDSAPWRQLPGQVERATNVYLNVAEGAVVREPMRLVADLQPFTGDTFDENGVYRWASIRGYVIAMGVKGDLATEAIHAWDRDGTPMEVVDVAGDLDAGDADFSYLPTGASADTLIEVASQYDTMIVTNRQRRTTRERAWSFRQSYNYIRNGHPNPPSIDGGDGDPLDDGGYDPDTDKFDTLQDARDTEGNTDDVNIDGHVIFVRNDQDQDFGGYYVYYSGDAYPLWGTTAGADSVVLTAADELFPDHGNWFRIPDGRGGSGTGDDNAQDDDNGQSKARLPSDRWPHRLILDEQNSRFLWAHGPWGQRLSGNAASNPPPSISQSGPVKAVAFYSNRLLMLGEQTMIGSRSQQFFQFFTDNVNAPTDADGLDLDLAFEDIGEGLRMVAAGERVFVTCESAQLGFGPPPDQPLTADNGGFRVITQVQCRDIPLGHAADRVTIVDHSLNVRQYAYINTDLGIVHSGWLNAHDRRNWHNVSPRGAWQVGDVVYVPDTNEERAFVHQQFEVQGQMIQSAWSTLRLGIDGSVHLAFEWEDSHVLVVEDADGYTLMTHVIDQPAPPGDLLFWPRLDRLEQVSGTYDEDALETTFTHTGRDGDLDTSRLVKAGEDELHEVIKPIRVETNGDVVFRGNHATGTSGVDPWLGFDYTSELVLSKLYPGISIGQPLITEFYVFHHQTTNYRVLVDTPDGTRRTVEVTSMKAGVYRAGIPTLDTGYAEVPSIGDGRVVTVTLQHTGPGQAIWSAFLYHLSEGSLN